MVTVLGQPRLNNTLFLSGRFILVVEIEELRGFVLNYFCICLEKVIFSCCCAFKAHGLHMLD